METTAKIQLSEEELALVQNTQWIITRHSITQKVFEMFGNLNQLYREEIKAYAHFLPGNIILQNGKISKGENYRQLPYVMLDYPAFFGKENIFAIRTMFWWGNFFSITLHISGSHKEKFTVRHEEMFSFLQEKNFFICVNDEEWQHDFAAENFLPATSLAPGEWKSILGKDFCKFSKKISLSAWENANEFLEKSFREILLLLQISYPAGRTGL